MDVDNEIEPLLSSMNGTLAELQTKVLQPFMTLDDDSIASHYTVDEQAKISLAAAFSLVMAYYSYKRINNEVIDAQLKLKVERVSDYVKKLREISEREKLKALTNAISNDKAVADDQPALKKSRVDKAAAARIVENVMSVNARINAKTPDL